MGYGRKSEGAVVAVEAVSHPPETGRRRAHVKITAETEPEIETRGATETSQDKVQEDIMDSLFSMGGLPEGELYPEVSRARTEVEEGGEEDSLLAFLRAPKRQPKAKPQPKKKQKLPEAGSIEAPNATLEGCLPYTTPEKLLEEGVFTNMREQLLAAAKSQHALRPLNEEKQALQLDSAPGIYRGSGRPITFFSQSMEYEVRPDGAGTDVQMFGVTAAGNSITVIVEGALPHFAVRIPDSWRSRGRDGLLAGVDQWKVERFYKALERRYANKMHFKANCILSRMRGEGFEKLSDYDHRFLAQYAAYKDNWLRGFEVQGGRSLLFYSVEQVPFLKIYVAYPFLVSELRTLVKECLGGTVTRTKWGMVEKKVKGKMKMVRERMEEPQDSKRWLPAELGDEVPEVFEANLAFIERFSIDTGIYPCTWYEIPASGYEVIPSWHESRRATTTLEIRVSHKCVRKTQKVCVSDQGEKDVADAQAQVSEVCFDIEARPPADGSFPKAKNDPVINIGCVHKLSTNSSVRIADIFVWGTLPQPRNLDPERQKVLRCHSFRTEKEMLQAFALFLVQSDPDRVFSYNGERFDFPYLYKRAEAVGMLEDFQKIGRLRSKLCQMRKTTFITRATGLRKSHFMNIDGRLQCDVYTRVLREKMRSHSLNAAAAKFLGDQKEEMGYGNIWPCFQTPHGRWKLAVYVQKDAYLPFDLEEKLQMCLELMSVSAVVGVQPQSLMQRGQIFRVFCMIHRECKRMPKKVGLIFVPMPSDAGNKMSGTEMLTREANYSGATVIEPKKGRYSWKQLIATHDFNALYPSIMRWFNLCFSTLIRDSSPLALSGLNLLPEQAGTNRPYVHIPQYVQDDAEGRKVRRIYSTSSPAFVDARVQEGVLPRILRELNEERDRVKNLMKTEKDKGKKEVLNFRQLALKLTANSVYGGISAQFGSLNFEQIVALFKGPVIGSMVTQVGRGTILETRAHVLNEYQHVKADVVYGDTDSTFTKLGIELSEEEQLQIFSQIQDSINRAICSEKDPDTGEIVRCGPMNIEFEKYYRGFLLLKKKRYIGMKALPIFDKNTCRFLPGTPKMDGTGMETQRRDNAPFVPQILTKLLYYILEKDDLEDGLTYLKEQIRKYTRMQDVPLNDVTISCALSRLPSDYKNKPPHVSLVLRIAAEDPAAAPKPGDGRVKYVMVRRGSKKVADNSELPMKAWELQLPLDAEYYVNKQLKKPTQRILDPIIGEQAVETLFFHTVQEAGGFNAANKELHSLSSAWSGFQKRYRCSSSGCTSYVGKRNELCQQCAAENGFVECAKAEAEVQRLSAMHAAILHRCNHECLRKPSQERIDCMADECPVFWRRLKTKRDLEGAEERWRNALQATLDSGLVTPEESSSSDHSPIEEEADCKSMTCRSQEISTPSPLLSSPLKKQKTLADCWK